MKRYLLCTDLDRTLIPNGAQPESPTARERFRLLAARPDVTLAYVSGRHRELIEQAIVEYDLPQPDYAIADVGSTIYRNGSEGWQQWSAWDSNIAPDWQGLSHAKLYELLSYIPLLKLQEAEKQRQHKLSFYIELGVDSQALIQIIDRRLKQADIKANLIWSIDEAANIGLLDVLPASANKRHAIHFLMTQDEYATEETMFAGDSGNDLDVLLSDIPSVLVANADAEIKALTFNSDPAKMYIAAGDFLGMNGNYSAGILEGAAHYWPEIGVWLKQTQIG